MKLQMTAMIDWMRCECPGSIGFLLKVILVTVQKRKNEAHRIYSSCFFCLATWVWLLWRYRSTCFCSTKFLVWDAKPCRSYCNYRGRRKQGFQLPSPTGEMSIIDMSKISLDFRIEANSLRVLWPQFCLLSNMSTVVYSMFVVFQWPK